MTWSFFNQKLWRLKVYKLKIEYRRITYLIRVFYRDYWVNRLELLLLNQILFDNSSRGQLLFNLRRITWTLFDRIYPVLDNKMMIMMVLVSSNHWIHLLRIQIYLIVGRITRLFSIFDWVAFFKVCLQTR